jgi:hypothetical protein
VSGLLIWWMFGFGTGESVGWGGVGGLGGGFRGRLVANGAQDVTAGGFGRVVEEWKWEGEWQMNF